MEAVTTVSIITPEVINSLRMHGYSLKRAPRDKEGKIWRWKLQTKDGITYPCDSWPTMAAAWADAREDAILRMNCKRWRVTHFNGNFRVERPDGPHNPNPGPTYGQKFVLYALIPETWEGAEGKANRLVEFLNTHQFLG